MNAQLAAGQLDRADIRESREGLHFCLRSSRRCRSVFPGQVVTLNFTVPEHDKKY